jgi:hypothetical protein
MLLSRDGRLLLAVVQKAFCQEEESKVGSGRKNASLLKLYATQADLCASPPYTYR